MKRFYIILMAMAILLSPVFTAATTPSPPTPPTPPSPSINNVVTVRPLITSINAPITNIKAEVNPVINNSPVINNNPTISNKLVNKINTKSSAVADSASSSTASQTQAINAPMDNSIVVDIDNQRELLAAANISANEMPILLNGRIGNYTNLPLFQHQALTPLDYKKDVVVSVLGTYSGSFLSRIRLEDLEEKLINKAGNINEKDLSKVRYTVQFKDSATTGGIGGGIAGSSSEAYASGSSAGSLAVLPGYHTSTANPQFIIKFYLIK